MKHVIVHIGPHKTGSTAIQKCLAEHPDKLSAFGVWFCHDNDTHQIALALAAERYDEAEALLVKLSETIQSHDDEVVILSQEDFSGPLPGRSLRKRIYPRLTKNMRVIRRALSQHRVTFVFFTRDEQEWLRSCYVQNLKHRTKFFDFSQFEEHFGSDVSWENKLRKPLATFGDELTVINYSKEPSAGIAALLGIAGISAVDAEKFGTQSGVNKSPTGDTIRVLEHVNRVSEFQQTAWFAKNLILKESCPDSTSIATQEFCSWPPQQTTKQTISLPALAERVRNRVHRHDIADILPSIDVDLIPLTFDLLPKDVALPTESRERIENQSAILEYHLRGKSRLAHLNALVISYLRRDTEHTDKARVIFHRIWDERGAYLINELSTRWLISTLQTFLDHGRSEAQRQIGTVGYFYANLMKIYEGERSLAGLEQSAAPENETPQTKNEFRGLDRFSVGGTDLMLNTNALALEIAQRDYAAGLILQELLLRVKFSHNAFTRLDSARKNLKIDVPGFTDTWSFFEP